MQSLYEILKTSKLGAGSAPDMYTALMSQKMGGSGDSVIEYTGTVPVTIKADGSPLLAYRISGNMQQTGTPTQQNPTTPQETGERTGNMVDISTYTASGGQGSKYAYFKNVTLSAGTYTFSCRQNNTLSYATRNTLFVAIDANLTYESTAADYHLNVGIHSLTFTLESKKTIILGCWTNTLSNDCVYDKFMLNTGSTALPYQPYGYKIPISSGGTTTPVHLGEVETTRRIRKLLFTGEESFTQIGNYQQSARFRFKANDARRGAGAYSIDTIISSHYVSATGFASGTIVQSNGTDINLTFNMQSSTYPDLTTFTNWLAQQYAAGTPVCVWYVLATPTTGIVNEPLRKIGEYADTISNVAEIPTVSGSQIFDVDTSLKPSEVYIKYKGRH